MWGKNTKGENKRGRENKKGKDNGTKIRQLFLGAALFSNVNNLYPEI